MARTTQFSLSAVFSGLSYSITSRFFTRPQHSIAILASLLPRAIASYLRREDVLKELCSVEQMFASLGAVATYSLSMLLRDHDVPKEQAYAAAGLIIAGSAWLVEEIVKNLDLFEREQPRRALSAVVR